jgi:hypothetical protein
MRLARDSIRDSRVNVGEGATYKLWSSGRGLKGATAWMLLALRNSPRTDGVTYGHVCDCMRVLFGQSSVLAAAGKLSFSWSQWLVVPAAQKVGRRKVSQSSGGR